MAMSSEDIVHHMACDMSQLICEFVPDWPFPDDPGDGYTDNVIDVFGDAPTKESVVETYTGGNASSVLMRSLNTGGETDVVTKTAAENLLKQLLKNNWPEVVR